MKIVTVGAMTDRKTLYGLDVWCLRKAEVNSLNFVINRFCMKLFRTNNMNTIKDCQTYFNLNLPSELLVMKLC